MRELRARQRLTQEEIADAAGVSRAFITELEAGRRGCSFERVVSVARALDIPLAELVAVFEARLSDAR